PCPGSRSRFGRSRTRSRRLVLQFFGLRCARLLLSTRRRIGGSRLTVHYPELYHIFRLRLATFFRVFSRPAATRAANLKLCNSPNCSSGCSVACRFGPS